jgi:hypothetical protein
LLILILSSGDHFGLIHARAATVTLEYIGVCGLLVAPRKLNH